MAIRTKEPRPEKIAAVAALKETLNASTVILTDFQGLNVKEISELRSRLRDGGCGYTVVKNTLFRLAASGTDVAVLAEGLEGPTAIVYTDDDPVAAARTLSEFARLVKPVKVKAGVVDGKPFDAKQIESLAKIPPRQELYAMVVGGLMSPMSGLVGTLQSLIGQAVLTLQAIAEQKEQAA